MAVAIDTPNQGRVAASVSGTTTFTTLATIPSAGTLVVLMGIFRATATTHTVSGGGLTWNQVGSTVVSGSLRISLWYAHCPSGLASGTTITCGGSAGTNDITAVATSYTGVATTSTITAFNNASGSGTGWGGASVAANSGDAIIGGAWGDGTLRTSTATSPATERQDFNSATTSGSNTLADKTSVSGTDSVAGTWSGTLSHLHIAGAFAAAAGGGTAHDLDLNENLGVTDAVAKAVTHPLTESPSATDALAKTATHPIADTASATDAISKTAGKAVADTASATDAVSKAPGKGVTDSASVTDASARTLAKTLTEAPTVTDAQAKTVTHPIADAATVVDEINTGGAVAHTRTINETLSVADTVTKAAAHPIAETVAATDAQAKAVSLRKTESLVTADAISREWEATLTIADTLTVTDNRDIDWSGAQRPWNYDGDPSVNYGGTATHSYSGAPLWTYDPVTG